MTRAEPMAKISNLDFYALLGVHPNAEDIVIRAAFKALAQRYHPDRFNGAKDEAHRRMADLTNAYETLSDPARRRKYDRRRGLSGRQARFYFKNPARDRQPFGALAARAAARKAQRYRMAVYVLMVIVVILSGFNLHQHAAQIKELFAGNRSSSSPVAVAAPGGAASAPASATAEAAPSGAPPSSTTANVRILPITQGITHPIGSASVEASPPAPRGPEAQAPAPAAADAQAPTSPAPDPQPAQPRTADAQAPAPPAAQPDAALRPPAEPASAAPATPPVATMKAPARPAAVEAHKAATATAAPAAAPAHKEVKRPAPKPVIPKAVEPDQPAPPATPPARASAAESERCAPELVALGLCGRSSTTKE